MYTFLTIQQQFRYAHFRTYSPSETIQNNLVLDLPLRALNFVKIFHYKAIELKARFPLTTFFYTRFAFNPFLLFLSVSHALFFTPRGLTLHLPSSLVCVILFLATKNLYFTDQTICIR